MKKVLGFVLSVVFAGGLLVSGPAFGQDKIKIGFIADMLRHRSHFLQIPERSH